MCDFAFSAGAGTRSSSGLCGGRHGHGGGNEIKNFHVLQGKLYYTNYSDQLMVYDLAERTNTFIANTDYYMGVTEDCVIYYDGKEFQIVER